MMSTPELASRSRIGHASADAHAVHGDQKQAHSRGGAMPRSGCCASVSAHQHEGGQDTRFRAGGFSSLLTCRADAARPFLAILSYRTRDSNSLSIGRRNLVTGCARFARQTRARIGHHFGGQSSLTDGGGRGDTTVASPSIAFHFKSEHQAIKRVSDALHFHRYLSQVVGNRRRWFFSCQQRMPKNWERLPSRRAA